MSLLQIASPAQQALLDGRAYEAGQAAVLLTNSRSGTLKAAGDAVTTHALSGRLYCSRSGWILMSVPNALVRGAFDAMDEPGIELPLKDGRLTSHVSVLRPEEIATIPGGIEAISERGHMFHFNLGPLKTVKPLGWTEMSAVWFFEVISPELQKFRRSYGLPSLPTKNGQELPFHCTVAVRRKNILRSNDVSKAASLNPTATGPTPPAKTTRPHVRGNAGRFAFRGNSSKGVLDQLLQAKAESDRRNYPAKHQILRDLMKDAPTDFETTGTGHLRSVTHKPSKFRVHLPAAVLP